MASLVDCLLCLVKLRLREPVGLALADTAGCDEECIIYLFICFRMSSKWLGGVALVLRLLGKPSDY